LLPPLVVVPTLHLPLELVWRAARLADRSARIGVARYGRPRCVAPQLIETTPRFFIRAALCLLSLAQIVVSRSSVLLATQVIGASLCLDATTRIV
jgi:hypothetical protein